jgi:Domain of unknown function (DUF4123)
MPDAEFKQPAEIRRDPAARERAIQSLWQLDGRPERGRQPYLYAILDAARDKRIYPELRRLARTQQVLGLYQGRAASELAAVAPYLVGLGTTDRVFDWLWEQGWGESWGIFLWSLVAPDTLRAHFRRLTVVRSDAGERLLFRFYDPRVLRSAFRNLQRPAHPSRAVAPDATACAGRRRCGGLPWQGQCGRRSLCSHKGEGRTRKRTKRSYLTPVHA